MGFEIEPFGGNEYAVRAVPDNLFSAWPKQELLMEMLDGLSEDSGAAGAGGPIYDRIASMSCKAAVKGNNRPFRTGSGQARSTSCWAWKIPMPAPTAGPPSFP